MHSAQPAWTAEEVYGEARTQQSTCAAKCYGITFTQDGTDWKRGKLQHLSAYIGTYEYKNILNDDAVKKALIKLVKEENIPLIENNISVARPVNFIDGNLILLGNAPHQGMEEAAIVTIRIYSGEISVALLHKGQITLYSSETKYNDLSPSIRDFIAFRLSGKEQNITQPADVVWHNKDKR